MKKCAIPRIAFDSLEEAEVALAGAVLLLRDLQAPPMDRLRVRGALAEVEDALGHLHAELVL